MATTLGTFTKTGDTYTGELTTLAFSARIDLLPVEGGADGAPDYRVYHGKREIGAGWTRRAKRSDAEFVSLKLIDPPLGPCAIYPALVESREAGTWNLILNEQRG